MVSRRNEMIQTERYLEEIVDRPIQSSSGCQTDLYLYPPSPPPPFIPTYSGIDVATQVEEDLIDDIDEVKSERIEEIVEDALAGALRELNIEEELAELRREKEFILTIRDRKITDLKRIVTPERDDWRTLSEEIIREMTDELIDRTLKKIIS